MDDGCRIAAVLAGALMLELSVCRTSIANRESGHRKGCWRLSELGAPVGRRLLAGQIFFARGVLARGKRPEREAGLGTGAFLGGSRSRGVMGPR
jgi:hypothetical protein